MEIFFLAILGTIVSIVIGTIWHMPKMWGGKIHMEYIGFSNLSKEEQKANIEEAKPYMKNMYIAQAGLSFLTSLFLAIVLTRTVAGGVSASMVYVYIIMIWLSFIVPVVGGSVLWGNNCKLDLKKKKFASDILYQLITLIAISSVMILFV